MRTSSAHWGLAVNIIVLWNTRYMEAALDHLRATGFDVRDEDVQRLTPLIWEHIELHGWYASPEGQLPAGTPQGLAGPHGAGRARPVIRGEFRSTATRIWGRRLGLLSHSRLQSSSEAAEERGGLPVVSVGPSVDRSAAPDDGAEQGSAAAEDEVAVVLKPEDRARTRRALVPITVASRVVQNKVAVVFLDDELRRPGARHTSGPQDNAARSVENQVPVDLVVQPEPSVDRLDVLVDQDRLVAPSSIGPKRLGA